MGKNHTEVICSFPWGAPRGSQCLPAAAPLQLGGLWKSASPHAAGASGTKGAAAAGALLGQLHGHLSAAPLVWADKLSWRGLFVLIYGWGDEWKFMGLFILIKSRSRLRRNRFSEKGTSKGKCVVRMFMGSSICKAEVCSSFMFVLLLTLFIGHFKNPQELPQIWNNICPNYSTALELMGYGRDSRVKGPAPWLAYSSLALSHTALGTQNKQTWSIYSVNPACLGELKHGESSCEVRLFRNTRKELQQKLTALDWHPQLRSWLSKILAILQRDLL